jgi:hypothetical protein
VDEPDGALPELQDNPDVIPLDRHVSMDLRSLQSMLLEVMPPANLSDSAVRLSQHVCTDPEQRIAVMLLLAHDPLGSRFFLPVAKLPQGESALPIEGLMLSPVETLAEPGGLLSVRSFRYSWSSDLYLLITPEGYREVVEHAKCASDLIADRRKDSPYIVAVEEPTMLLSLALNDASKVAALKGRMLYAIKDFSIRTKGGHCIDLQALTLPAITPELEADRNYIYTESPIIEQRHGFDLIYDDFGMARIRRTKYFESPYERN